MSVRNIKYVNYEKLTHSLLFVFHYIQSLFFFFCKRTILETCRFEVGFEVMHTFFFKFKHTFLDVINSNLACFEWNY